MRYVDLYTTVEQDGQMHEVVTKANITLPLLISPYKVSTIEPYFTPTGKQYKNVSIISYETGEKFKVVGNYQKLYDRLFIVKTNPIGFNNGKQVKKKIEDGTKIKSSIKRGTKKCSS